MKRLNQSSHEHENVSWSGNKCDTHRHSSLSSIFMGALRFSQTITSSFINTGHRRRHQFTKKKPPWDSETWLCVLIATHQTKDARSCYSSSSSALKATSRAEWQGMIKGKERERKKKKDFWEEKDWRCSPFHHLPLDGSNIYCILYPPTKCAYLHVDMVS